MFKYTESEKLDSAYAEYGKTYEDGWNFEENITLKKLEDSKIYEFKDTPKAEIFDNVNVFVTEFVEGKNILIVFIACCNICLLINEFYKLCK